jgi:hypothetical protein
MWFGVRKAQSCNGDGFPRSGRSRICKAAGGGLVTNMKEDWGRKVVTNMQENWQNNFDFSMRYTVRNPRR